MIVNNFKLNYRTDIFLFHRSVLIGFLLCITVFSASQKSAPNIILVLTDDLDLTLGGAGSLKKTKKLIGKQGLTLSNWFVHTPVCCPSRAELLTGRMFHNLKVRNMKENFKGCMHVNVSKELNNSFYSQYYFARHFSQIGYTVGVFGKHLNFFNPEVPPDGVDRWLVNGGGNYNDPTFSWASTGVKPTTVHFNNCTGKNREKQPCYSTSVIGNSSINWIKDHFQTNSTRKKPFFALVSVKAPHIQDGPGYPVAIPAPWYINAPVKTKNAPRTLNYNASCLDHHWLVRQQQPLTVLDAMKIDELYTSRLRALMSVDDLVEEMVDTLDQLHILDETYIIFTSDNGYRFGQFRMPQGKWHTYENDIRVPLMIRGPRIHPDTVRGDILGTHVDLIPTLLGLAKNSNSNIPSTMDGEDLSWDILDRVKTSVSKLHHYRRPYVLIEYIGLGNVIRYGHLEDTYNNTFRALRLIDDRNPEGRRNVKYVEFTDCERDWDFKEEPLEYELFDLDNDPFEMTNLLSSSRKNSVPKDFLHYLKSITRKLFNCSGQSCRITIEPWSKSK